MTVNAANAVLKSLEEPPEKTVFVLVTCEPGRLLPTIRSRCRVLDFERLSRDDLSEASKLAVEGAGIGLPDDESWQKLMDLGGGRVGRVVTLHDTGGVSVFEDVEMLLGRAGRPDWSLVHALGDKLAPASALQRFNLFFDLLLEKLAQRIRIAAGGSVVPGGRVYTSQDGGLISTDKVAHWAELWEEVSRSRADVVSLNLDRKAYLMETATRLHDLAKR